MHKNISVTTLPLILLSLIVFSNTGFGNTALNPSGSASDDPKELVLLISNAYDNIHNIIHDPLFGLKTWTEFQDEVDQLVQYWERYKCFDEDTISQSVKDINLNDHHRVCMDIETCLNDFINSLDSGFQPDFELPCDSLGQSIDLLNQLYGIR